MKELLGKTVEEMYVNQDQSLLKFVTDEGVYIYETEADCCSETWFADINFGYRFFNREITSQVELDIPEWLNTLLTNDGRTRQDCDQVYGYQLVANRVTCDIIFRNSSNGYYGGSCGLMDTTNKYSIKQLNEAVWTQITEDWKA